MVDLVKLRKKAKEKKAQETPVAESLPEPAIAPESEEISAPPAAPEEDVAAAAPEPASEVAPPAEKSEKPMEGSVPAEAGATPEAKRAPMPEVSEKLEKFRRTAGLRQADALSTEAAQETIAEDILELLLFRLGEEQYALPIETIVEITRPRSATHVPNSGEEVVGIISLRGTVVTILDVRRKLGHADEVRMTDDTRVIVVEYRGETCGFLVDRVSRVVRVARDEIENHPVVNSSEQSEFIRGVFQHNQKLSILLDLDRLLQF